MKPSEFDDLRYERPDLFDSNFIHDREYKNDREFLEETSKEQVIVGATVYVMSVGHKVYHLTQVRRSLSGCL